MTYVSELVSQVTASLMRNKLRTLLTMAGIAWGLASILLIVAMGDGFKEGQRNNMKTLGENLAIIFGGRTELQAGGERAGRRVRLNYSDVENMRRECYAVSLVTPELQGNVRATSPYNSGSFDVSGVEPEFNQLRTIPVAEGRFISPDDERTAARVCIIGEDVKKQLFGNRPNTLGAAIAINSLPFRVIGILANKDQNSSYSGMDEKKIFLPYSTMARDVPPKTYYVSGYLDEILYRPRSLEDYETAQDQVKRVIARAHGFDPRDKSALGIWDTVEDQQQVAQIFDSMTIFLAFIALVTPSLGGIGVMNIMLVTVSERTARNRTQKSAGRHTFAYPCRFSGGRLRTCICKRSGRLVGRVRSFQSVETFSHTRDVPGSARQRRDNCGGIHCAYGDRGGFGHRSSLESRLADSGGGVAL